MRLKIAYIPLSTFLASSVFAGVMTWLLMRSPCIVGYDIRIYIYIHTYPCPLAIPILLVVPACWLTFISHLCGSNPQTIPYWLPELQYVFLVTFAYSPISIWVWSSCLVHWTGFHCPLRSLRNLPVGLGGALQKECRRPSDHPPASMFFTWIPPMKPLRFLICVFGICWFSWFGLFVWIFVCWI